MKISNIIIAALAIIILVILLSLVAPLTFLVFGIPIALFAYLLILAKRYVNAKSLESATSKDLNAKIIMLSESLIGLRKRLIE